MEPGSEPGAETPEQPVTKEEEEPEPEEEEAALNDMVAQLDPEDQVPDSVEYGYDQFRLGCFHSTICAKDPLAEELQQHFLSGNDCMDHM